MSDDYPLDYDYSIKPITAHIAVTDHYDVKKNSNTFLDRELTISTNDPDNNDGISDVLSHVSSFKR